MTADHDHDDVADEPSPFARLIKELDADPCFDVEAFLRAAPDHAPALARRLSRTVRAGLLRVDSPEVIERIEARFGIAPQSDGLAPRFERTTESAALSPGALIGERFRVIRRLGRGGMGEVWRALDLELDREVALKVVTLQAAAETDPRVDRFLREVRITSRLEHPAIVPVYGRGVLPDGRPFFAMKIVDGETLLERIESGDGGVPGLPAAESVRIALRVCEALEFAHGRGVIHRDVTPLNVMLGHFGEVQLVDWGLALDAESASSSAVGDSELGHARARIPDRKTLDGSVFGTPSYMSPEQARGETIAVDARTDVFGVGAILCHAASGAPPYHGRTPEELLDRARSGSRNDAAMSNAPRRVPSAIVAICDKALRADPSQRYATVGELGADLRAFLDVRVVQAHESGAVAELRMWARRNRGAAWAVAVALIAAIAAGYLVDARRREVAAAMERGMRMAFTNRAVEHVRGAVDELWPLRTREIPRLQAWLESFARDPLELDVDAQALAERFAQVQARALPRSEEQRLRDERTHARFPELEKIREQEAYVSANIASRARGARIDDPLNTAIAGDYAATPGSTPVDVLQRARQLVHPEKREFGREIEGWALASRASREIDEGNRDYADYVLAQACFVNGHDERAREHLRQALEQATDERRPIIERLVPFLDHIIAEYGEPGASTPPAMLEQIAARRASLEEEVGVRRTFTFDSMQDAVWHAAYLEWLDARRLLFDERTGIARGTEPDCGWSVKQRLDFLLERRRLLDEDPALRGLWDETRSSLRTGADPTAIEPQIDLLPLGRDSTSGRHEFAHLPSGRVPARGADGRWIVDAETCIVLVLIPGGDVIIGAQSTDSTGPNFDPDATAGERLTQSVSIDPYFLSKYELTRGQWRRLTGRDPSYFNALRDTIYFKSGLHHPVEQVAWSEARDELAKFGLELPTEVQWEHAARAGTTTRWFSGGDARSVEGFANLADRFMVDNGGPRGMPYEDWLDDGASITAPVGRYRPNAFGLHDTIGNVFEMTRDDFSSFGRGARPGDGEFSGGDRSTHAIRGGSMQETALGARVSRRLMETADDRSFLVGVRPARRLSWGVD